MTESLPHGVWFEARRRRYRVRLYHRSHVIWRTYHATREEALEAHRQAVEFQKTWLPPEPIVRPPYPQTVLDLFQ